MKKIVPLAGTTVRGPLGVAHLPRLWLKGVLAAGDALPEGFRIGNEGADHTVMDGIGLDPAATLSYLSTGPSYIAFEAWVREHAARLDGAAIAVTNAAIDTQHSPENALADWRRVHAAVVAQRGASIAPIVPAVSSQSAGPLGLMHLPRFWMKATLAATGALIETWNSGRKSGFDVWFCGATGIDLDASIAYIQAELPSYSAFETWTVAAAAHLSAADIGAHNAAMRVRQKPAEVAARERALLGIDAPEYQPSIELNDLVDWHTIHADVFPAKTGR